MLGVHSKEQSMLIEYQKKLQAENQAKANQIKALRTEVDRISNSRIRYVSAPADCSNCRAKDTEISTLNKNISHLKEAHEREVAALRKLSTQEPKIMRGSQSNNIELINLRKSYDVLQEKYNELLRKEQSTIKERQQEERVSYHYSNGYVQENSEKVKYLENKVMTLEDANRVLREQILSHINSKRSPIYSEPITQPTLPSFPVHRQSIPSSPIYSSIPRFHDVSFPRSPTYRPSYCNCEYHSPLQALQRDHSNSSFSFDNYSERDLLKERWMSLQKRIRKLEQENTRLRGQVCPIHG